MPEENQPCNQKTLTLCSSPTSVPSLLKLRSPHPASQPLGQGVPRLSSSPRDMLGAGRLLYPTLSTCSSLLPALQIFQETVSKSLCSSPLNSKGYVSGWRMLTSSAPVQQAGSRSTASIPGSGATVTDFCPQLWEVAQISSSIP